MKTINIFIISMILGLFITVPEFSAFAENDSTCPPFVIEEESYIDDIPFNTYVIFQYFCYRKAMSQKFDLEDEPYIDDIPFDTKKLVNQYRKK